MICRAESSIAIPTLMAVVVVDYFNLNHPRRAALFCDFLNYSIQHLSRQCIIANIYFVKARSFSFAVGAIPRRRQNRTKYPPRSYPNGRPEASKAAPFKQRMISFTL